VSVLFPNANVVVGQMNAGTALLRIVNVNAEELIPAREFRPKIVKVVVVDELLPTYH
jgi:hypothetical protein